MPIPKEEAVLRLRDMLYEHLMIAFDCTEPNQSDNPAADWEAIKEATGYLDDCCFFDGTKVSRDDFLAMLASAGSLCPDYRK